MFALYASGIPPAGKAGTSVSLGLPLAALSEFLRMISGGTPGLPSGTWGISTGMAGGGRVGGGIRCTSVGEGRPSRGSFGGTGGDRSGAERSVGGFGAGRVGTSAAGDGCEPLGRGDFNGIGGAALGFSNVCWALGNRGLIGLWPLGSAGEVSGMSIVRSFDCAFSNLLQTTSSSNLVELVASL